MGYKFLSDEWLSEAARLSEEIPADDSEPTEINIIVTGGPDGDRELHLSGQAFRPGLTDSAKTKVTVPFTVAKAVFVDGDQTAATQAVMQGQLKIEGDVAKMLQMQRAPQTEAQQQFSARLKEITTL